jgi:hypothetical protein
MISKRNAFTTLGVVTAAPKRVSSQTIRRPVPRSVERAADTVYDPELLASNLALVPQHDGTITDVLDHNANLRGAVEASAVINVASSGRSFSLQQILLIAGGLVLVVVLLSVILRSVKK